MIVRADNHAHSADPEDSGQLPIISNFPSPWVFWKCRRSRIQTDGATAFQQVEDYIAELRVTSQQLNRQEAALSSAQTYVTLETGRYETGLDPYPDLITAQLTLLSSEEARATLRMNELTEAVELIQSLGGGWNVSQLPSPKSIRGSGVVQQVKDGP